MDTCKICQRDNIELTFHHLIPKTLHDNSWFKKNFDMYDMQRRGINVCKLCHRKIHDIETEKNLGRNYNTLEKLLEHEEIKKFIPFAKKQKN